MNKYNLRGNNPANVIFASLNGDQPLKERNCSYKVDPILGRLHHPGKQRGEVKKVVNRFKIVEKCGIPVHNV